MHIRKSINGKYDIKWFEIDHMKYKDSSTNLKPFLSSKCVWNSTKMDPENSKIVQKANIGTKIGQK